MKLNYQEKIDAIDNCPAKHEKGERVLFRCVEKSITLESFQPQAVLRKPKYQKMCKAWGLSTTATFKGAKRQLKNLSGYKEVEYKAIAKAVVTDNDGVKYCDSNRDHYTFFPAETCDLISKFKMVQEDEK